MHATPATHDFLEHTGELRLRVRAASLEELFAEAGRALGAAMHPSGAATGPAGAWHEVEASGGDRPALLVAWLNELVFVAEQARVIPAEFDQVLVSSQQVRARVRGPVLDQAPSLVKAATMDAVRLAEIPGGVEAEVTLDI